MNNADTTLVYSRNEIYTVDSALNRIICYENEDYETAKVVYEFENKEYIKFKDIDFFNGTDNFVTLETLYKIRKYILEYSQDNAFKQYKWLFFSPFPLISIEETRLISQFAHLEQKIDTTQLTEENSKDFAKILSERVLNLNDSYELLCFVQNIKSTTIKKTFFLALDFNNIQYYFFI